ncbi:MAG: phosphatase PAP2 family protein [Proteobacteria bacterium]|jgi:lipid A 4'-phosphatase|nr:phosphatase PAP2 family protein [Pseudomonadota bacterium]
MLKSLLSLSCIIVFSIFIIYSANIDYMLSTLSYNQLLHSFYGETHLWCRVAYNLIPVIVIMIISLSILALIFSKSLPYNLKTTRKFTIILLVSLFLSCGLITNIILKGNWGRPRPYQVLRDHKKFRPVYAPNFGAITDNSFPSGHASIGFFLGVPFLILGRRRQGLIISIFCGFFIGLVRMLQGGHYFTDVIFSGIIVWSVAEFVIYLFNKFIRK